MALWIGVSANTNKPKHIRKKCRHVRVQTRTYHSPDFRFGNKKSDWLRQRGVKSITPVSADKIYEIIIAGPRGERLMQGEKAVALCRRAWRVVHRLYPSE